MDLLQNILCKFKLSLWILFFHTYYLCMLKNKAHMIHPCDLVVINILTKKGDPCKLADLLACFWCTSLHENDSNLNAF